mmetsp:Transcript_17082/g.39495  ORF Transcript_17082/g.39495 Transcript_17082/m.39495 type:complete len:86 (+) Transcript_17082:352-609(+)
MAVIAIIARWSVVYIFVPQTWLDIPQYPTKLLLLVIAYNPESRSTLPLNHQKCNHTKKFESLRDLRPTRARNFSFRISQVSSTLQ